MYLKLYLKRVIAVKFNANARVQFKQNRQAGRHTETQTWILLNRNPTTTETFDNHTKRFYSFLFLFFVGCGTSQATRQSVSQTDIDTIQSLWLLDNLILFSLIFEYFVCWWWGGSLWMTWLTDWLNDWLSQCRVKLSEPCAQCSLYCVLCWHTGALAMTIKIYMFVYNLFIFCFCSSCCFFLQTK